MPEMTAYRDSPRNPTACPKAWLFLAIVLLATALLRIHLLDVPLERDEGEYAYTAMRFLHGEWLYRDIYTMKLPGTHLAYALIMGIFGQSARGIHLGLLVLTGLNQLLLYGIGRRLSGQMAGMSAAAVYGLLAMSPSVLGFSANTEHFVLAPALLGFFLILRAGTPPQPRSMLMAGVCFGVAAMMKQHGAVFAVAAAWTLLLESRAAGRSTGSVVGAWSLLVLGAVAPFLFLLLALALSGSIGGFFFWVFEYSLRYVGGLDPSLGWMFLTRHFGAILLANPLIWFVAAVGGVLVLRRGRRSREFTVLVPLVLLSALAVAPGLYFRPHYFVLALPATALLFAVGLQWLVTRVPAHRVAVSFGLLLVVGLFSVIAHREVLFTLDPDTISRRYYGRNPFAESERIAKELADRSGPEDSVAVVGSEPQMLFLAGRKSATSYIYTYPLMESHPFVERMQEEMIGQIRAAQPRLLVFVNVSTSWLAGEQSDQRILNWAQQYWRRFYRRVGVIELVPGEPSKFRWDEKASAPRGDSWIAVFERSEQP